MVALDLCPTPDTGSHFEEIFLKAFSEWAKPAVNVVFMAGKPGFHNSGRPHIAVVLDEKKELTVSDGANHVVGLGGCVLSEDTTGKGRSAMIFDIEPFKLAIMLAAKSAPDAIWL